MTRGRFFKICKYIHKNAREATERSVSIAPLPGSRATSVIQCAMMLFLATQRGPDVIFLGFFSRPSETFLTVARFEYTLRHFGAGHHPSSLESRGLTKNAVPLSRSSPPSSSSSSTFERVTQEKALQPGAHTRRTRRKNNAVY